eukprot:3678928-Prymnesium_polylepis.2
MLYFVTLVLEECPFLASNSTGAARKVHSRKCAAQIILKESTIRDRKMLASHFLQMDPTPHARPRGPITQRCEGDAPRQRIDCLGGGRRG